MICPLEVDSLEKDLGILKSLGFSAGWELRFACHLPTNTEVDVNMLEKSHNAVAGNISEVEMLQSLEHRNIVPSFSCHYHTEKDLFGLGVCCRKGFGDVPHGYGLSLGGIIYTNFPTASVSSALPPQYTHCTP